MSIWPADLAALGASIHERGLVLGARLQHRERTESTNDDAKAGAKAGAEHGTVWIAEHQESGRGRQGRAWASPPGENVLMSVLVRGRFAPQRVALAALVTGLAVRAALAEALPERVVRLKWPNDVQVVTATGPRKLAGILVEAQSRGAMLESLVIGIGINVHTRVFPDDLAHRASSVALEGGLPDRARLVADVLGYLDRHLAVVLERGLGSLHAELERHDALLGMQVESESGGGVAEGIDAEGRLLVRDTAGEIHAWGSGEVHLVPVPAAP
ncbi:MAG: biotin--[acetyl-CoA-carboxylase] ligase, partial [Myxococcales bacterium]